MSPLTRKRGHVRYMPSQQLGVSADKLMLPDVVAVISQIRRLFRKGGVELPVDVAFAEGVLEVGEQRLRTRNAFARSPTVTPIFRPSESKEQRNNGVSAGAVKQLNSVNWRNQQLELVLPF